MSDPVRQRQISPGVEPSMPEPMHRSDLHTILTQGLAEAENHRQQVEALDFPPEYPGTPQEEQPPTYEQASKFNSIRWGKSRRIVCFVSEFAWSPWALQIRAVKNMQIEPKFEIRIRKTLKMQILVIIHVMRRHLAHASARSNCFAK